MELGGRGKEEEGEGERAGGRGGGGRKSKRERGEGGRAGGRGGGEGEWRKGHIFKRFSHWYPIIMWVFFRAARAVRRENECICGQK